MTRKPGDTGESGQQGEELPQAPLPLRRVALHFFNLRFCHWRIHYS